MPLSKEQIISVRDRLNQEGINDPELLNDLSDHICCAIESEMSHTSDFACACNKIFSEFCPEGGFVEIQTEVNHISHNNTIVMKKTILILALLASIFFFAGILINGIGLLNNYKWAFMEEIAFTNQYMICLFILPLYWLHQYRIAKKDTSDNLSSATKQLMFMLGFLCSEALVNALFFKIMHMPGGNQLFIISAVLGMIYVPFYLFRKYKLEF